MPTVARAMVVNAAQLATYTQAKQTIERNCELNDHTHTPQNKQRKEQDVVKEMEMRLGVTCNRLVWCAQFLHSLFFPLHLYFPPTPFLLPPPLLPLASPIHTRTQLHWRALRCTSLRAWSAAWPPLPRQCLSTFSRRGSRTCASSMACQSSRCVGRPWWGRGEGAIPL